MASPSGVALLVERVGSADGKGDDQGKESGFNHFGGLIIIN